jgi:hypothetical protein
MTQSFVPLLPNLHKCWCLPSISHYCTLQLVPCHYWTKWPVNTHAYIVAHFVIMFCVLEHIHSQQCAHVLCVWHTVCIAQCFSNAGPRNVAHFVITLWVLEHILTAVCTCTVCLAYNVHSPVFLNRCAMVQYQALALIILGHERFS